MKCNKRDWNIIASVDSNSFCDLNSELTGENHGAGRPSQGVQPLARRVKIMHMTASFLRLNRLGLIHRNGIAQMHNTKALSLPSFILIMA